MRLSSIVNVASAFYVDAVSAGALLASVGLSGACGAAAAARAERLSDVINAAVGGKRRSLALALKRMIIAEIVHFAAQIAKDWVNDYGKRRIIIKMKLRLLRCLLAQDIEFFEGERAARAWDMSSQMELTISNLISVPLGWIESATRIFATLRRLRRQSGRLAMLMTFLLNILKTPTYGIHGKSNCDLF